MSSSSVPQPKVTVDENERNLVEEWKHLTGKEFEIRVELRRNGGHKGKVDNRVLAWLERFERFEMQANHLCENYSSPVDAHQQVLKLMDEVQDLNQSASSLSVLFVNNRVDRGPGISASRQPITGKFAREVSNKIFHYLTDPATGTVGLYGVGGVGKTTIMKNICSELSNTEIFNKILWITLSKKMKWKMNLVSYKSIQDDIAVQLGIKLLPNQDMKLRALKICENLKIVGKWLFIFDDMWRAISLGVIGIPEPERNYGCKIVITTRISDVCEEMRAEMQIELAPLFFKEAWDLFVSKSGDQALGPKIESIAKEIVHECGGLPIAIVTIGHAMRDEVNVNTWRLALEDLQSANRNIQEGIAQLFRILFIGYTRLKNDQVRECFLCCAIFPEDYKFESTEVILYWMAEDFVRNKEGILSSIDDGLEILKELQEANMLELFMEGEKELFKMHDLFRELAISIMPAELSFVVKAGMGLTDFAGWRLEAKRLSLITNQIANLDNLDCPHISTLLLRDNPLTDISDTIFYRMPSLQVLDLSYSGITWLPPLFSELYELRVLFLNFCTSLKAIPSLKELKKLEFLHLRGTLIKKMPEGVDGLVSLRSLDLSDTVRLEHIQDGTLSSLSNLEELQMKGCRLCLLESPMVATCLKEIKCLETLCILTLSAVGSEDHLDTILHLQGYNLKSFVVNVYGSSMDYTEDM